MKPGFTLLEVLISLVLISFVLLGINGIMLHALQKAHESYYKTVGIQQIISMKERLKALKNNDGISDQIALWNAQNKDLLPQGEGSVSGFYPSYHITLHWEHCLQECLSVSVTV